LFHINVRNNRTRICPIELLESRYFFALILGLLSGLGDTLGRALGNIYITAFANTTGLQTLTFYMYIFLAIIYSFMYIWSLKNYSILKKRFLTIVNMQLTPEKEIVELGTSSRGINLGDGAVSSKKIKKRKIGGRDSNKE